LLAVDNYDTPREVKLFPPKIPSAGLILKLFCAQSADNGPLPTRSPTRSPTRFARLFSPVHTKCRKRVLGGIVAGRDRTKAGSPANSLAAGVTALCCVSP